MFFDLDRIFNSPTLKDIFPTPESIGTELLDMSTNDFLSNWVYESSSALQTKLQGKLNSFEGASLNKDFQLLMKNLIRVQGNAKILGTEEQFKSNFINDLMEKLPYYLGMFKDWNLDPLKSKQSFNQDGVSSYNGSQNTENNINDIKNFDNVNLSTFTPREIEEQQKLRSNKINEFVYSFNYLFNGVE